MFTCFAQPLTLILGFPTFLTNVVIEKERKLIEIMKINGLNMNNYWAVNYVFNYLYYLLTVFMLVLFGRYILEINVYAETSLRLQLLVFCGWGLTQISFAFFLSVFFNKSTVASISAYMIACFLMIDGCVVSFFNYAPPSTMPWYFHLMPHLTFVRACQHMQFECIAWDCYRDLYDVRYTEAWVSIFMLYVHAVIWMVLAWYASQVVPQNYGVPKPWNFLWKNKRVKDFRYDFDEIGELEENREQKNAPVYDYNQELEDADSKAERNYVYNLDKADYYKFPLIVKDMRKEF